MQTSRRSSTPSTEAIHGYTLLFPPSWSMPILSSLVYAGCLVGGLRERRTQHHEAGIPSFPEHYGRVCPAGSAWELRQAAEAKEKWTRKPPGKRVEWTSVGTSSPWVPDWEQVLRLRREDENIDMALDEETALNGTAESVEPWLVGSPLIQYLDNLVSAPEPAAFLLKMVNAFRAQRHMAVLPDSIQSTLYTQGLLHVRLDMLGRGSPGDVAVIYALGPDEREQWLRTTTRGLPGAGLPVPADARETKSLEQQLGELVPPALATVGYTTSGNYSLSRGRGHALGSISLAAYVEARRVAAAGSADAAQQVLAKVKNRDGRLCRLAAVELV